jgi:hypothetical protein
MKHLLFLKFEMSLFTHDFQTTILKRLPLEAFAFFGRFIRKSLNY